jgi:hypothetical protein
VAAHGRGEVNHRGRPRKAARIPKTQTPDSRQPASDSRPYTTITSW